MYCVPDADAKELWNTGGSRQYHEFFRLKDGKYAAYDVKGLDEADTLDEARTMTIRETDSGALTGFSGRQLEDARGNKLETSSPNPHFCPGLQWFRHCRGCRQ